MSCAARDPVVGSCAMCVITVTLTVHFGFEGPKGALEYGSERCMLGLRLGCSVSVQDHGLMQAVVKLIKKLLMSSSSDINGLYSLSPMILPSVY